jgi:hypothetical protein
MAGGVTLRRIIRVAIGGGQLKERIDRSNRRIVSLDVPANKERRIDGCGVAMLGRN